MYCGSPVWPPPRHLWTVICSIVSLEEDWVFSLPIRLSIALIEVCIYERAWRARGTRVISSKDSMNICIKTNIFIFDKRCSRFVVCTRIFHWWLSSSRSMGMHVLEHHHPRCPVHLCTLETWQCVCNLIFGASSHFLHEVELWQAKSSRCWFSSYVPEFLRFNFLQCCPPWFSAALLKIIAWDMGQFTKKRTSYLKIELNYFSDFV